MISNRNIEIRSTLQSKKNSICGIKSVEINVNNLIQGNFAKFDVYIQEKVLCKLNAGIYEGNSFEYATFIKE